MVFMIMWVERWWLRWRYRWWCRMRYSGCAPLFLPTFVLLCDLRCWMNAPSVSLYTAARAFWSILHAYLLEFLRGEVFNYLSEEPSCLRKRAASSIIILYCCLDSWTENNYPGYSRVTVYSFCAVLHRAQIVSFWIWSSTPEWLMLQTSNQG